VGRGVYRCIRRVRHYESEGGSDTRCFRHLARGGGGVGRVKGRAREGKVRGACVSACVCLRVWGGGGGER